MYMYSEPLKFISAFTSVRERRGDKITYAIQKWAYSKVHVVIFKTLSRNWVSCKSKYVIVRFGRFITYPRFLAAPGAISMLNMTKIRATERTKRRATVLAFSALPASESFCCSLISVIKRVSNIWKNNETINKQAKKYTHLQWSINSSSSLAKTNHRSRQKGFDSMCHTLQIK